MSSATCLSDEVLLALADGALAEEEREPAQAHLDSCADCRRLLVAIARSGSDLDDTGDSPDATVDQVPVDLPVGRGTIIARYRVVGILGAGGMGAVYDAYDPELDRCLAIKLVHPRKGEGHDGVRTDRVRREARAMAQLVHPNVVQVYDVGEHGSRTFIAMELVEGKTLRAWVAESPRPIGAIVDAFVEAGRGLAAAHAAGLLHRDFKPDNVFVSDDGQIKVGDFGLARSIGPALPRSVMPRPLAGGDTRTGRAGGTPAYLAPEVLQGQAGSAASDQFSFCVSLWEAVYGERPFTGPTAFALLEQARAGKVQPASSGKAPAWLRRLLMRGLAADPADRHPSMAALLHALDRKARRAHLAPLAALATTAILAMLALGVFRPWAPRCSGAAADLSPAWSESRRKSLEAAFRAAGQDAAWPVVERALAAFGTSWSNVHTLSCRATRVDGHQSEEVLERRSRCLNRQREVVSALGDLWLSGSPALLEKAPGALASLPLPLVCAGDAPLNAPKMDDPPEAAAAKTEDLRRTLSMVTARLSAGEPGSALVLAKEAAQGARQLAYAPLEAEALLASGRVLTDRGEYPEAEQTLRDATLAAVAAGHEQVLAETMVLLARIVGISRARFDEGEVLLARAAPVVARVGDRMLSCELESVRGSLRFARGDAAGARPIFTALLPVLEGLVGRDHPAVGDVRHNLFLVALRLGLGAEARAEAEATLRLFERALPPGHVRLYPALIDLAATEADLGNLASAHQFYEKAVAVAEKAQGPEGPYVASALGNLAMVLDEEGDVAAARKASERALRIARARGPTHPFTVYLEVAMGERAWRAGATADALAHLRRGAELRERRYGRRSAETGEALALLGRARLDAGGKDGLSLVLEADHLVGALTPPSTTREFTAYHACEALLEAGRPLQAAPHCRRTLIAARAAHTPDHPQVIDAQRLSAEMDLAVTRGASRRAGLESALAGLEKRGGAWPRNLVETRFALARVLADDPDRAARLRAVDLARSALELARQVGTRPRRVAPIEAFLAADAQRVAEKL